MYEHRVHAAIHRSEEGIRFAGTGVTGSCHLLFECWELNSDSVEEQLVLSTAKPSLQPFFGSFLPKVAERDLAGGIPALL